MLQVNSSSPKLFSVGTTITILGFGFQPLPVSNVQPYNPQNISFTEVYLVNYEFQIKISPYNNPEISDTKIILDLKNSEELKKININTLIGKKFDVLVKVIMIRAPDSYFFGQNISQEDLLLSDSYNAGNLNSANAFIKKYTVSESWSAVNHQATYTFDDFFQVQITSSSPKIYSQGKLISVIGSGFSQNNGILFIGFLNIYDPNDFFIYDYDRNTNYTIFIFNSDISGLSSSFKNEEIVGGTLVTNNDIVIDLEGLSNVEGIQNLIGGKTYNIFIQFSQWNQKFTSPDATFTFDTL